jgi:predicted metal-dependent phosphoesterase TrpH
VDCRNHKTTRFGEGFIRLKCDLHTHLIDPRYPKTNSEDRLAPQEVIDIASSLDFDVLAFTCHNYVYHDADVWAYAKQKGIILVPGTEKSINHYHVLFFNCLHAEGIRNFEQIRHYKRLFPGCLTIAPHPFYKTRVCLGRKLLKNIDCFDAIEYCHFYSRFVNPNRKAARVAKRYGLPMLGCSDAHRIEDFGTTYSYVYVEEKSVDAIIEAIKAGRVEYRTSALSLRKFMKEILWIIIRMPDVLKGEANH